MPDADRRFERLKGRPQRWVVTGAAGFIGSHLVQALLSADQQVVGVDNLSTGSMANLEAVRDAVGAACWSRFHWIEMDIRDGAACRDACDSAEIVLHQAAVGSVPRSIEDPVETHDVNVTGALNVFDAARRARAKVVYASSSAVYGDATNSPACEPRTGAPLSPYAVTKAVNELYARNFHRVFGLKAIGLRYFNIFGPRQDPSGSYAAVIPKWIQRMVTGAETRINGDGGQTRDFCHVDNVVRANILAALADVDDGVFNIGMGGQTSLGQLHSMLSRAVQDRGCKTPSPPQHGPVLEGEVRHSVADIGLARDRLGYSPVTELSDGLRNTVAWFARSQPSAS